MIYLLPLILIFFGHCKFDSPQKANKGELLWGTIYILLVLIMGLRYKVGGDTYNYMSYFYNSPEIQYWEPFDFSGFEPGFSAFTSLIKTFTDNIFIYQTVISAIMTFMLMLFIKRYTEYKFLALFIIYIAEYPYFSTEIVRESIAIGGLLLSYDYMQKKKYVRYFFFCILLTTIHSSAVVAFLFPIIVRLKFNRRMLFYILGMIFLGFFMAKLMDSLAQHFFILLKLLRYTSHNYVGYFWCGFRFLYFSLLPMWILKECRNRYKLPCQFEGIICFQIVLGFGLWFVPVVFQRLINYTIVFYFVSMAQMLGTIMRDFSYRNKLNINITKARLTTAKIMICLTLLAHSSYYIHLNFYERYIPYHSIFDPIDVPLREKYIAGDD